MTSEIATGPIACDFAQIPASQRDPLLQQLRAVFRRVTRVIALTSGYGLEFPGERGMVTALSEIIEYDRLCCPFIRHALIDEPWGGSVRLELTGTEDVREFLAGELLSFLPQGTELPVHDPHTTAAQESKHQTEGA